jgi:hypothetical protein
MPSELNNPAAPRHSSFASFCRGLLLFLLIVGLLGAWFESSAHDHRHYIQNTFILVGILIIIFFADALEVAYSLLRYKLLEQFGGTEARILKEMHDNEDFVYEAREWLVTFLIVLITVMADFDEIYFPYIHREIGPTIHIHGLFTIQAKTLFSILFTTLPVLWLAQGPSKTIGREYPQKMLAAGMLVWELIKRVGQLTEVLGLNAPTRWMTRQVEKLDIFKARRPDGTLDTGKDELDLKPSDNAYFVASVQRYGYCLHEIAMRISIDPDGSAHVTQRVVYYAISQPCNVFVRRLALDSRCRRSTFAVKKLKAYSGPVIQESDPRGKNDKILCELNTLGDPTIEKSNFKEIPANLSVDLESDQDSPNGVQFRIDTHGSIPTEIKAYAILVELTASWNKSAFQTMAGKSDFFFMTFECPCYRYQLSIDATSQCRVHLADVTPEAFCANDPHWGERDRLQRSLSMDEKAPTSLHCEILYPFPGIKYKLSWKLAGETSQEPTRPFTFSRRRRRPRPLVDQHP